MANLRIDDLVDVPKIMGELATVKDSVKELVALVQATKGKQVDIMGAKTIKEFSEGSKIVGQYREKIKEVVKVVTDAAGAQREINKAVIQGRVETAEYNKQLKEEIVLEKAATGSINEKKVVLAQLQRSYDALSDAQRDSGQGQALLKQIQDLDKELKKLEGATGRFQRNVGNYSGATKILEGALGDVKKKLDQFRTSGQATDAVVGQLAKEEALLTEILKRQELGFATATQELKANQQALLQMEQAGLKGGQAFQQLALQTGQLKDQVGDLAQRTKVLGSDTFVFDGLIQSAQALAGMYGVAQGAAALFGDENEDLQKTFVKLQAVMTILHSLQSIGVAVQKEGAAVQLLSIVRTKALSIAQGAYSVVVGTSTGALRVFKLALAATGVGLAIILLGELVNLFSRIGSSAKDAAADVDLFNASLENQKSQFNNRIKFISDANKIEISLARQRGASQDELNQLELKGIGESNKAYRKELVKRLEDFKKLEGVSVRGVSSLRDAQQGLLDIQTKVSEITKGGTEELSKQSQARIDITRSALNNIIDLFQKVDDSQSEFELGSFDQRADKAEEARKKREEAAKKSAEKTKQNAEKDRQAQFEIFKLQLQSRIDFNQQITDDETMNLEVRNLALRKYVELQVQIIEGQYNFERTAAEVTAKEMELIEAKKQDALQRLEREGRKKYMSLVAERGEDEKEIRKSTILGLQGAIDRGIEESNERMRKEVEAEKDAAAKIKDARRQLYEELSQLAFTFLTASIEREKNAIQEQIDALETKKQKDIEVANATYTNTVERAAAIQIIETRAAAQREQLEMRQRQLNTQKAKFDRAQAIAGIIQNTARGVVSALASFPPNPVLAALVGAIGAIQLATVLATPIPKYKEGHPDHPGGKAEMGHGKRELVVTPDGMHYVTGTTPQVVTLPRHTVVYPDAEAMGVVINKADRAGNQGQTILNLTPVTVAINRLERTVKRKQETHFHLPGRWDSYMKNGSSFRSYLNNRM